MVRILQENKILLKKNILIHKFQQDQTIKTITKAFLKITEWNIINSFRQ
jgi:hypothetical protein